METVPSFRRRTGDDLDRLEREKKEHRERERDQLESKRHERREKRESKRTVVVLFQSLVATDASVVVVHLEEREEEDVVERREGVELTE